MTFSAVLCCTLLRCNRQLNVDFTSKAERQGMHLLVTKLQGDHISTVETT